MYDNYNYPEGADGPDAPWNQEVNDEEEVEVVVSITLSKVFKVRTDEYYVEKGDCYEAPSKLEFMDGALEKAVKEQVILPQEAHLYIAGNTEDGKKAIRDLKDWDVDDFEVMEN